MASAPVRQGLSAHGVNTPVPLDSMARAVTRPVHCANTAPHVTPRVESVYVLRDGQGQTVKSLVPVVTMARTVARNVLYVTQECVTQPLDGVYVRIKSVRVNVPLVTMAIPVRTRAIVFTVTADLTGPVFVTKDGRGLCAILHVLTQTILVHLEGILRPCPVHQHVRTVCMVDVISTRMSVYVTLASMDETVTRIVRLWRMDQTVYTSVTSVFIATRVILLLAGVIACPGTLGISVSSHVRKVSLAINVNRFAAV